ncbi:NAD-dependent epimerase/dehydratase family protein [Pelagicoccus sp. SDUM812003]|uniref:NAD-dependent epimerase/dehydratase family protein n=1 Tax=Pelagicoccus sp. SDUM812003 TaxID=3041267 RepID=UPI00280EB8C5|nr:NAD-dependent epimerase/dehydratase family protein [Pelagicoccus sp. SDUM812003]MDQ8203234.1 NAD-dependent epimerase/dehydratase family protein [Pelagicoccus sp. SDUM812003]
MKCLIIGSGQFLGPKVVEELVYAKHEVAFLDNNPPPAGVAPNVTHIMGDKASLGFYREECVEFEPDVAIHLSANNADEARAFVETFDGVVSQIVVTSNTNVYLAHARLRETEPGPSVAVPIDESSPLRTAPLKEEDSGDKLAVEKIIKNCRIPSTILRLAPLYGPNDFRRRFYPMLVRMIDERPHVIVGACQANWKWSHLFVKDAARAVALAAASVSDKKRIYNVAELKTPTMLERIEHLGTVFGWEGRVGVVSDEELPDYMKTPGDFAQDLEIDSHLIRSELEYKEVGDYYDGLAESVEWYRKNPPPEYAGKTFNYSAEDSLIAKEIR